MFMCVKVTNIYWGKNCLAEEKRGLIFFYNFASMQALFNFFFFISLIVVNGKTNEEGEKKNNEGGELQNQDVNFFW